MEYLISIIVTKVYRLSIEADSKSDAINIGENLQTTEIEELGSLDTVSSSVVGAEEE